MGGIGGYTDPERESYCRDLVREQMPKDTNCEKTSRTMEQFKELIADINKLREKEKLMIEDFEKSTCELSEVFHWIIKCELDGNHQCFLSIHTCLPLYAKALEKMGFEVREHRNCFDALDGYNIYW